MSGRATHPFYFGGGDVKHWPCSKHLLLCPHTAGFLVFKPELISRLEQGQEPWVIDLQGVEGAEAPWTSPTGEV